MSQAYLDALVDSALKAIDAVADDQGSHLANRIEALHVLSQHASVAIAQKQQEMGYTAVMRDRYFAEMAMYGDD